MKPVSNIALPRPNHRTQFRPVLPGRRMTVAGFTLIELMMALGIFTILIAGLVAMQLFGMRVYTLAGTKLMATTKGRQSLNAMRDQIRSAQQVYVGIFDPGSQTFSRISNGVPQIGNALQLYTVPTSQTTLLYTIFYMDPSVNTVYSITNNPATSNLLDGLTVLATYMTNYYCFDAENYQTNVQTDYQNNPVIGVTFNFSQWEYPIGFVGGVGYNAYDYYYLRTHVCRRCKQ